jgi:hypothetical protein
LQKTNPGGDKKGRTMKPLIQIRKSKALLVILLALAWSAVSPAPNAFGVVPPPDGGYPNFTTAEGTNALRNLTTGAGNTAVGWFSLFSATTASFNTGVGAGTLALNTGDNNTAVGTVALFLSTTGVNNTAVGSTALLHNDSGGNNTGIGAGALTSNTTGNSNTATGVGALGANVNGGGNTATGTLALSANNGALNTAIGLAALQSNTTGSNNTAMGAAALNFNTMGHENTAVGQIALQNNITGVENTAIGAHALSSTTGGNLNTAVGFEALAATTGVGGNTAVGVQALAATTSGTGNIALGYLAGADQTTGEGNVYLGTGMSGVAGENDTCYIASIFGQTSSGGSAVFINANGKLGTSTSSQRFKDDIKPMEQTSEILFGLKPVTFRYKKEIDSASTSQFGLVAEEVEKVNPDLVTRDKEGKPYGVRYEAVNAMLLNEFLKEHRAVQELKSAAATQEAKIARQQKQIETLTAGLQKVSARLAAASPSLVADSK